MDLTYHRLVEQLDSMFEENLPKFKY